MYGIDLIEINMKKEKSIWIVEGHSESGDDYGPERYNKQPTMKQLREFVESTGEELDIGGSGDFGSYVYLKINKI